jgi:hypothetical protein
VTDSNKENDDFDEIHRSSFKKLRLFEKSSGKRVKSYLGVR